MSGNHSNPRPLPIGSVRWLIRHSGPNRLQRRADAARKSQLLARSTNMVYRRR